MILAAGALATPRLLLRSGVGPRGRESEMLPEGAAPFAIDNPRVGVGVFDHVISLVAWDYSEPIEYQAYDYGDFAANHADLERYLAGGSGPYAQYRPVSILDYAYGGAAPDTEIFVDPNGVGPLDGKYRKHRALATYVMLLDPIARGLIRLDEKGDVRIRRSTCRTAPRGQGRHRADGHGRPRHDPAARDRPGPDDPVRAGQREPSAPRSEQPR